MKTTWKELKDQVRKLLFADEATLPEYDKHLCDGANYAMMEVFRFVRPIVEMITLSHFPPENLLCADSDDFSAQSHIEDDIVYTASGAKSYYFECDGTGQMCILNAAGDTIAQVQMASERTFKAYRGFVPDAGDVTLVFSGDYLYRIRNVALYGALYSADESDIEDYGGYTAYDMIDLTYDETEGRMFLAFAEDFPVMKRETGFGWADCREMKNYIIQKGSVLLLPRASAGEYEIYYKKYPKKITADTPDDFELEADPQTVPLIPLLMAYRILKDDDERLAKTYYNEYQAAKEELLLSPVKSVIMPAEVWEAAQSYGL
jgi:hypothetical protein